MKFKNICKIFLDISMLILFFILCFGIDLSIAFHEFAGIAIFIMFIIHLVLNADWIENTVSAIFRGKNITKKNKINFALDSLLFIGMLIITVSGVLISKVLFFDWFALSGETITTIHNIGSYICLGVICLHTLLHLRYLYKAIVALNKNRNNFIKASGAFVATAAVFFSMYSIIYIKQSNSLKNDFINNNSSISGQDSDDNDSDDKYYYDKNDDDNSQQQTTTITEQQDSENNVSLEEFLSKLYCTGCGRACPLTNPQCGRGAQQAQEAQQEYNNNYSSQN